MWCVFYGGSFYMLSYFVPLNFITHH
jgi:hypothetical protein